MKSVFRFGVTVFAIGGAVAIFLNRQEVWAKKNSKPALPISTEVFDLSIIASIAGLALAAIAGIGSIIIGRKAD